MLVLEITNLVIDFETDQGVVEAIDHLTLSAREGEILGVVGESGCGKTTVARSIMGVVPQPPARLRAGAIRFQGEDVLQMAEVNLQPTAGEVRFEGRTISGLPAEAARHVRRDIQYVYQDPGASLAPWWTVGRSLPEKAFC